MMWLAKRTRGSSPSLSVQAYARWNRFIIGSCGGLVLASVVLFPLQVVLNYTVIGVAQNSFFGPVFFYTWLAWLLLSVLPVGYKNYFKLTLLLCGASLALVLPLNIIFGVSNVINLNSSLAAIVDISFMVVGIACIFGALKIKNTQNYKQRYNPHERTTNYNCHGKSIINDAQYTQKHTHNTH